MENAFTKEFKRSVTCKNCKSEISKQSLSCAFCGAKNTYPEILAAYIVIGIGAYALLALYQS